MQIENRAWFSFILLVEFLWCVNIIVRGLISAFSINTIASINAMKTDRKRGKIGEEDRINLLPDDLLVDFISCLPKTKEAFRTSTLSRRWHHLWTSVPNLIFPDKCTDNHLSLVRCIDETINQLSPLKLIKFQVNLEYHRLYESKVNTWIRYAANRNVQDLDISIKTTSLRRAIVLDQFVLNISCFTCLKLGYCVFNPTGAVSWKNLKSLCISYAKLDEDLIQNILSGSPVLETLELNYCYGFMYETDDYLINGFHEEEYINDMTEEEEMLKGFVLNLRHVKELKLGFACFEVLSRVEAKGFELPSNIAALSFQREVMRWRLKMAVFDWNEVCANPARNMQRTWIERCETQRQKNKEMRDRDMHVSLQQNLMEHIWQEVEHEDEDF
nr:hypothetical protein [Tanacetum cinerariifolium]